MQTLNLHFLISFSFLYFLFIALLDRVVYIPPLQLLTI